MVASDQSWPLTLDRAHYESEALVAAFKTCPNLCPEVYHADRTMATIVMRYIGEKTKKILRATKINGGLGFGGLEPRTGTLDKVSPEVLADCDDV